MGTKKVAKKAAKKEAKKAAKAAKLKRGPEGTVEDDATLPPEGAHRQDQLGLRATAKDAAAAAKLTSASGTSTHALARHEVDLVVEHAAAILAQKTAIESKHTGLDVAGLVTLAKATQPKLDLADRLQGSYEAARAAAKTDTQSVTEFATLVSDAAEGADAQSPIGKALGAFRAAHVKARGVAKTKRTKAAKKKSGTPKAT
jgi:hypothetical protein